MKNIEVNTENSTVTAEKGTAKTKNTSVKYIVGGAMVAFGLILVIIGGCLGGWGHLSNFSGFYIDFEGVHFNEGDWQIGGNTNIMAHEEIKDIRNLDLDVDYGELIIKTGEGEDLEINTRNIAENRFKYKVNGDTLEIKYKGGFTFFTWRSDAVITITLPKGMEFDNADIDNGAGKTDLSDITAKKIDLDNGAGELVLTNISASEKMTVNNGAGEVRVDNLNCGELKISGGVGEIRVENSVCGGADIDNGIGSLRYNGEINGDAKINNGIGELRMSLKGNSSDYSFKVDSGIGQVKVNGNTPVEYGNAKYNFKVETGIGEVRINFE